MRADLDHDGRAELIVANHDGQSNGMGIDWWTISIFPDATFTNVAEPLIFSVEEYGTFGTFVADRRGVSILTSRWVWTNDPKGTRDVGVYLVGHWWRYKAGELVPQTNRAPVARRYLFSFANERGETSNSDRVPYRWVRNAKTEIFKSENITGPSSNNQTGTIQEVSISKTGIDRSVKITFLSNGGRTLVLTYPEIRNEQSDADLAFIGDAASGLIYPIRYLPARIDTWLKAKRATLRTYGNEPSTEKILWLER